MVGTLLMETIMKKLWIAIWVGLVAGTNCLWPWKDVK
jgi:hypothetical protein